VLRFENLVGDFNKMLEILEMPEFELKHKNKSKHEHWKKYYTRKTIKIVHHYYRDDFKYFGYG